MSLSDPYLFRPVTVRLCMTELTLDQPEGMFSFSIHSGFKHLDFLDQGIDYDAPASNQR
jgi:hypothetical protein